jgi:hypothetical protein
MRRDGKNSKPACLREKSDIERCYWQLRWGGANYKIRAAHRADSGKWIYGRCRKRKPRLSQHEMMKWRKQESGDRFLIVHAAAGNWYGVYYKHRRRDMHMKRLLRTCFKSVFDEMLEFKHALFVRCQIRGLKVMLPRAHL